LKTHHATVFFSLLLPNTSSIIAVSYEARKFGIRRFPGMSGNEATKLCPEIHLFRIPEKRGKANLDKYRETSKEVMEIFLKRVPSLERASVDEAFLEITDIVQKRIASSSLSSADLYHLLERDTMIAHYDPNCPPGGGNHRELGTADLLLDDFDDSSSETAHDDMSSAHGEEDDNPLFSNVDTGTVFKDNPSTEQLDFVSETEDEEDEEDVTVESSQEKRREGLRMWLSRDGQREDLQLAVGAVVVQELRRAVFDQLGITCSAGVSYNKMLAKLAAGMNKPNGQTILPFSSVRKTFDVTPIKKVRNFGGKFGSQVKSSFSVEYMGELRRFSVKELSAKLGNKSGQWLYNVCRGVDDEPLRIRYLPKSISCGKNFPGPDKLKSPHQVQTWLHNFAEEVVERMEVDKKDNHRVPTLMSVYICQDFRDPQRSFSRSSPVVHLMADKLAGDAWKALCRSSSHSKGRENSIDWSLGVVCMGLSLSKFQPIGSGATSTSTLHAFFPSKATDASQIANPICNPRPDDIPLPTALSTVTKGDNSLHSSDSVVSFEPEKQSSAHDLILPKLHTVREETSPSKQGLSSASSVVKEERSLHKQKETNIRSFLVSPSKHTADSEAQRCRSTVMATPTKSMHTSSANVGNSHDRMPEAFAGDLSSNYLQILDAAGMCVDVFDNLPRSIQCEILRDMAKYGGEKLGAVLARTCEICGERVSATEEQVHRDHHLALQLSQTAHCTTSGATGSSTEASASTSRRKRPSQTNHLERYLKREKK
jgi:nucleotidyltransferase/DNA polymerase involved in DNA repair